MSKTQMKAPKGTSGQANIEGHLYEIPKSGVIDVVSENHIDTLRLHGFTDHHDDGDKAALAEQIDAWGNDDKDELVEFIEERGGSADNSMGTKKLRRLAREAAGIEDED